jgi:2-dehydropantoate 2-reductase
VRYLIFGSGAIGTLLGGLLAGAGHHVVFIGRKWNIEGIRSQGIKISGVWGDYQTGPQSAFETVAEIPEELNHFDQVLLCVKAFDTAAAIQSCLLILGDATQVISFQNGYGNCQMIAEHIGWHRTLGARVITGVELPHPGVVQVTVHADAIRLGHYLCQTPMNQLEGICLTLREAGILVEPTEQLEEFIWAKILYNSALNPLGALLQVPYGALGEASETRTIMESVVHEAFTVTQAQGIRQFWQCADAYLDVFYQKMLPPTAAHYPSMLRDLEKGRRTEIDALNGAISRLGKEQGVPTPINDLLTSLLHFRESYKKR